MSVAERWKGRVAKETVKKSEKWKGRVRKAGESLRQKLQRKAQRIAKKHGFKAPTVRLTRESVTEGHIDYPKNEIGVGVSTGRDSFTLQQSPIMMGTFFHELGHKKDLPRFKKSFAGSLAHGRQSHRRAIVRSESIASQFAREQLQGSPLLPKASWWLRSAGQTYRSGFRISKTPFILTVDSKRKVYGKKRRKK